MLANSPILGSAPSPTQHEVLQNFLKSSLNAKDRVASPRTSLNLVSTVSTSDLEGWVFKLKVLRLGSRPQQG